MLRSNPYLSYHVSHKLGRTSLSREAAWEMDSVLLIILFGLLFTAAVVILFFAARAFTG